jgi:hypothetical protein
LKVSTTVKESHIEISLAYCDDEIIIIVPSSDAVTEHPSGNDGEGNVVTWSIGSNNVADDASRVAGAGGGHTDANHPVNLTHGQAHTVDGEELIPVVKTMGDIRISKYLGLDSNNLGNMEFMWRIWYSLLQLRACASDRAYNAPTDRTVSFGKHKNRSFFEMPLLHPGYCAFILKSVSERSSEDFKNLHSWLCDHWYEGSFTQFE